MDDVYDNSDKICQYQESHDISLRNEIVMAHMSLVKSIAVSLRNIYTKYAETEDIIDEGIIALIAAIDSFDVNHQVKFSTYASIRIRGSIIDFVRQQDRVPRSLRTFGKDLDLAYSKLYNSLNRTPTDIEVASELGISLEKYEKRMSESAGIVTLSFEELLYEDNFTEQSSEHADYAVYENELKEIIAAAIDTLTIREKQVVTLYYYEQLKFTEIASVLNITQPRVCQIHTKAMLLLKNKLQSYMS